MNMEKTNLVQSVMLPLSKIEANRGQIVGLPKNPRVIRDAKFEILKKSIQEDPEMTALREILVIEYGSKYVIIGGNMRFRAMQDLGIKQAPCKIIPAGTDVEKLKAYTIKDNAGFGEWDWDDLANEWADEPLQDWGVDVWETEEEQSEAKEEKDLSDQLDTSFRVEVTCINEAEQELIYNELTNRGLVCKILTL
jgi:ParB-like chromosome segregation protein Spo0J